jgi:hypothetical protein
MYNKSQQLQSELFHKAQLQTPSAASFLDEMVLVSDDGVNSPAVRTNKSRLMCKVDRRITQVAWRVLHPLLSKYA